MKNKQFIVGLLFNGLIAQSGSNQIVVEETMFMDAPYVGEITTTDIKYAADGLYREETQMEVGSFLSEWPWVEIKNMVQFWMVKKNCGPSII